MGVHTGSGLDAGDQAAFGTPRDKDDYNEAKASLTDR